MPSRSLKAESLLVGIQASAGSAASSFVKMGEVGVTPGIRGQVDVFEAANQRIPSDLDNGAEWAEIGFESRIFFNAIGYFLASAFGAPTTTTLTDAGAKKHVWTIRGDSFPTRKLLTLQKGNSTDSEQWIDCFVNQLGWSGERLGTYNFTGRLIGQPHTRTSLNGSPTTITKERARARKTGFYMSDSLANLATALGTNTTFGTIWGGKVFSFNFSTADMSHPKWVFNPATTNWDDYIEDSITPTIEVVTEANAAAMDPTASTSMMYALRNGSVRYLAAKVLSPTAIVATDYYMFLWEAAAQLNIENMDVQDTQGVVSFPWRWNVIDDGSFSLRITVVNTTASY